MGNRTRFIISALGLMSSPALAADQFDLACHGQYRERINAKPKPTDGSLRIDLKAGSWCAADCKTVFAIAAVEPGRIVLSQSDPADTVAAYNYYTIDRVSGEYHHHMSGSLSYWDDRGVCEVRPFSGFPAAKF